MAVIAVVAMVAFTFIGPGIPSWGEMPGPARKAIIDQMQVYLPGQVSYYGFSQAQKGKPVIPAFGNPYEEVWCVILGVSDKRLNTTQQDRLSHWTVQRRGLLWEANPVTLDTFRLQSCTIG